MQHRILALDIGASTLKMAEFIPLKAGGIELVNFAVGSLDLDQQSEAERVPHIVATCRDMMREQRIQPGPVLISVSGQSVFSRFVKLPVVDRDKIYQIILYEAQQNVPFPIEEVVWDYQLIGRGEGEVDVMLAAIKADIIVNLTDAVEEAGLQTDLVDVAPMALYNAVRYNYDATDACTLVVDIGARSTDLIFMEQGRVFIRSVPVAGNAITQQIMREFELSFPDAEDMKRAHAYVSFGGAYEGPKSEVADKVSKIVRSVMTRMHAEVDRSIKFYRSQQNGQQPSLVLLTGGCSVIPYSDNFLKEKLKVEVDYLNPFINVPVSSSIPADEIGKHAHVLGQVVGLALRKVHTCPIEINLLSPKVVKEKAFRRKQPMILLAAAALVLTLAVWCGYFFKLTALAREQAQKVQSRVQALEEVERPLKAAEQEIASIEARIATIDGLLSKRTQWIGILSEIERSLPADLWLTSIYPFRETAAEGQVSQGRVTHIEISGLGYIDKVNSAEPIRVFRDNLRAAGSFSEKTEITHLPAPTGDRVVREFKIVVHLKNPLSV